MLKLKGYREYIVVIALLAFITNYFSSYFIKVIMKDPNLLYRQVNMVYMILVLLTYFAMLRNFTKNKDTDVVNIKKTFWIVGFFSVAIYPTISCDIFYYLSYSIMQGKYGLNPYMTQVKDILGQVTEAPFYMLTGATTRTAMTYGYGYTWYLKAIYFLSFGNFYIAFYLLKFINLILVYVATKWIYKTAKLFNKNISEGLVFTVFALNPLVLIETVGNGHNDIFFMLLVIIAIYYLYKEHFLKTSIILIIAFHTKANVIFILCFVFCYYLKKRVSFKVIWVTIGLFILSFIPYLFYGITKVPQGLKNYKGEIDVGFIPTIFSLIRGLNLYKDDTTFITVASSMYSIYIMVFAVMIVLFIMRKKTSLKETILFFTLSYILYLTFFTSLVFVWYILWTIPILFCIRERGAINLGIIYATLCIIYEAVLLMPLSLAYRTVYVYGAGTTLLIIILLYEITQKSLIRKII